MHILAAVAHFERELIRERVAAGIKAAQKTDTRIGRPKAVFNVPRCRTPSCRRELAG
jgi:DNA invertase Pin-like site-specific DNA recombinase